MVTLIGSTIEHVTIVSINFHNCMSVCVIQDELCEPLKHSVKAQVDRSNPQNKLLDYLEWMDAAKRDVQWQV